MNIKLTILRNQFEDSADRADVDGYSKFGIPRGGIRSADIADVAASIPSVATAGCAALLNAAAVIAG